MNKRSAGGWLSITLSLILAAAVLVISIATVKEKVEAVVEEPMITSNEVEKPQQPDTGSEEPSKPEVEWHFYNSDIQNNGTAKDDYNFGPAVELFEAEEPAMVADAELRARITLDPALGAADMAWFDSIMGTRYLGLFYDECEEKWDAAINQAKQVWMEKPEKYKETREAFFKFLDSAVKVEIKDKKGLEDQMYMNPYTSDGVPDVIVMKTSEHSGKFLVYTFEIKGTTRKEVAYRLDCGYQPTNVAKIMNIKPKQSSSPKPVVQQEDLSYAWMVYNYLFNNTTTTIIESTTPGPGPGPTPTPTPTPGPGPTPTPTPTPAPRNPKDPTKGTPVLPNDEPGPGSNTNNPSDPNKSTKENPNNSNNLSPDDYDKTIKEMEEANKPGGDSQPGGAPNNPTYTPPSNGGEKPNQDNNANNGTGSGGIDKPTDVKSGTVSDEPAGDAWDGPPD